MMKWIRRILGAIILAWEAAFPPTSVTRAPAAQAKVDAATASFSLYQFQACPFCVKVRRAIKRMGLKLELRDALNDSRFRQELLTQGGSDQVPCLRIAGASGEVRWLYESSDIIAYLEKEIAAAA